MLDSLAVPAELAWPLALALAWIAGELGHRLIDLPRISCYGLIGFLLAASQLGVLPGADDDPVAVLAHLAFSLILFELGYRINLRWLRSNPWLGITALVEASATFIAVLAMALAFGISGLPALLLAALAMSTSPAGVLRVINEQRSSGQVTERLLHLSAFNCVLAVFVFKVVLGFWVFDATGKLLDAVWSSLVVLLISAALGIAFGLLVPALLRTLRGSGRDVTLAFAIAVIVLVALTHALKFSPVLASLCFGLVVRHRRITRGHPEQNFGALGNLLTVLLFVFVASTLQWSLVWSSLGLALALVAVRLLVKTVSVAAFAQASGITWRKGVLTGLGLAPMSVFVLLLIEQSRHVGIGLVEQLAAVAGATLILELLGPIITQRALIAAHEADLGEES